MLAWAREVVTGLLREDYFAREKKINAQVALSYGEPTVREGLHTLNEPWVRIRRPAALSHQPIP
jgi:hypothetical protein